ncbi:MAG: hypothetical protein ACRDGS_08510, partial [Chloroflexota bacterium]
MSFELILLALVWLAQPLVPLAFGTKNLPRVIRQMAVEGTLLTVLIVALHFRRDATVQALRLIMYAGLALGAAGVLFVVYVVYQ